MAGHFAVGQLARGDLRNQRRIHLQLAFEIRFDPLFTRLFLRQRRGGLHFADRGMRGAALGGVGERGDARALAEQLPREFCGRDGDIGKLVHGWVRNNTAIGHEHDTVFAEARVLNLHHHAA